MTILTYSTTQCCDHGHNVWPKDNNFFHPHFNACQISKMLYQLQKPHSCLSVIVQKRNFCNCLGSTSSPLKKKIDWPLQRKIQPTRGYLDVKIIIHRKWKLKKFSLRFKWNLILYRNAVFKFNILNVRLSISIYLRTYDLFATISNSNKMSHFTNFVTWELITT